VWMFRRVAAYALPRNGGSEQVRAVRYEVADIQTVNGRPKIIRRYELSTMDTLLKLFGLISDHEHR
ncbi:hypothetical protein, partial [Salinispora pacifica]|uniref:hypothetical protein n=1 Tax=Salinispora pacifica TaxID=351187 RepID=UPI001EE1EE29